MASLILSIFLSSLFLGWGADKLFGDPTSLPHLIVLQGKAIAWGEQRWNKGTNRKLKGAAWSLFLIVSTFTIVSLLLFLSFWIHPILALFISSIIIFYSLSGKTLIKEVKAVFEEVNKSLDRGQKQVGRIVGRDTSVLTEEEVKKAALETLSENLSDGVVAPLFWFLLLGPAGMLTYKMINTLDSMIGYKNERYLLYGRFAAKTDDIANYIPARLTALLMLLVSNRLDLISFVRKYGRAHTSPNSGFPEAALAGVLSCRFGGAHLYFGEMVDKPFIGENEKILDSNDLKVAIRINKRVEFVTIVSIFVIGLFILISTL